ncbi:hypothetical protein LTR84_001514 [Exophiala bonariae]|uniref:Glycerate-and formate-dehydrogenase n=1 Tax=Exophiala bonariae TaxID=1690606 RepID=A0AAV9NCT5_9EURO|nr:hypothetical protein LTR84_001514 [Exophiala bonariae]
MASSPGGRKPLVVSLGDPKYIGKEYLDSLRKDFDFQVLDAINRAETIEKLPKLVTEYGPVDAFIIRMGTPAYEPFDKELLGALVPHCKIIASASAGYNEFDVDWMTKNGIWFCNTIDGVAEATADMALFLILAVLRNTTVAERQARNGTWKQGIVPSKDPTGLTLGIVGMGSIGKYIAKKAAVFNMKILYHNRHQLSPAEESKYSATYAASLHDLLRSSDVVSISCPLNAETTNLISTKEFAAMKDGVYFVNTARGAIVDEDALVEALQSGKVTRAGLDVVVNEPHVRDELRQGELSELKVILQPHMGGLTDVAFHKSEKECFENIKSLFKTGRPVAPVNEV